MIVFQDLYVLRNYQYTHCFSTFKEPSFGFRDIWQNQLMSNLKAFTMQY